MIQRRQIAVSAAVATVAFVALVGARPIRVETIVAGYALALAAIALAALTGTIREARHTGRSRFQHELQRKGEAPGRPAELIRVTRDLTLASTSAGHAHERLRPTLYAIAEARSRNPRQALGEDAWALVDPQARPPEDRNGPGVPLRRIRAVVDALEKL